LTCLSVLDDDIILWHKRLGHASFLPLNKLISKDLVVGLASIKFNDDKVSDALQEVSKLELLLSQKIVLALLDLLNYYMLICVDP